MELNVEKIEAAAALEVADRIMEENNFLRKIDKLITEKVDRFFAETADKQISDTVSRAIQEGFDHEYRRIDTFGREQGEVTTIRRELEKTVKDYWTQHVDDKGKPETSSYGTKTTRAQYVMIQMVGKDFSETFKAQMVNVTAHLKDGFRAEMRKWVDDSLGNLFNVRSQQDQAEGRYK